MKIYVIVSKTKSMLGRAIQMYTKMPYNHTSISLDSSLKNCYSFGRKIENNPFIGGLVMEDFSKNKLLKDANIHVLSLEVSKEQYNELAQMLHSMYNQKELYHYSIIGLLAIIMNKPYKRKNFYYCSEFVSDILKESDVLYIDERKYSGVVPLSFLQTKTLEIEYVGNVQQYFNNTIKEL